MADLHSVTVYRIYNVSGGVLHFDTTQGFNVSLTPGGAVDLYSYELEGSKTFEDIDDPDKILKLSAQKFTADDDFIEELKADLPRLREAEPPEQALDGKDERREHEPQNDVQLKEAGEDKPPEAAPGKEPVKKRKSRGARKPPSKLE